MPSYKNFETKESLHNRRTGSATDNYDPWDNPTVKAKTDVQDSFFQTHIKQYSDFISWAKWYPDLFLDLMREKDPQTGKPKNGVNLHFDQRVFLRSIARFQSIYGVFPRGWGKCVAKGTYIFTSQGLKRIEDFFDNEENGIEDYSPKMNFEIINKNQEAEKVDRGAYNGYKDTLKFKTKFGYKIECTYNHPLMARRKDGIIDFVMAYDLREGDELMISSDNFLWAENKMVQIDETRLQREDLNIGTLLGVDFATIIGYIVASGDLEQKDRVSFICKDKTIEQKCKKHMETKDVYTIKNKKGECVLYGKKIREYLYQLGLDYVPKNKKQVPKCILEGYWKYSICFLRGFFSIKGKAYKKDGFFEAASSSEELMHQIQLMLLNLGIVCSVRQKEKGIYVLRIMGENIDKFAMIIGLENIPTWDEIKKICRKPRSVNKNKYQEGYFFDKIKTIEKSKNHVYDISVPESHSFVSNGFISHNTWGEVISMFITAILYPGKRMSLTAQTRENAANLLYDKYKEITEQYPLLKNEMFKPKKSKDTFELQFTNGSIIDSLANSQTSKGNRRHELKIEESALVDNITFEDALKPIVEIGRTTKGQMGIISPFELNQKIDFFTTSGFRRKF